MQKMLKEESLKCKNLKKKYPSVILQAKNGLNKIDRI